MTTTYGRIKTKGTRTVKEFESPKAARTAAEKLIAQKLKKGYTQTSGPKTQAKAKPTTKKTAKKKTARKAANMNGFRKMQQRLRKKGWYVGWGLPCCITCAWGAVPSKHEVGPFKGQPVDFSKVLINHEQDCGIECDYDEETDEIIPPTRYKRRKNLHYRPNELGFSCFCFDGSAEGVKNLEAIIPIIKECGCKIEWSGKGENRPFISWSLK